MTWVVWDGRHGPLLARRVLPFHVIAGLVPAIPIVMHGATDTLRRAVPP